MTKRTYNPEDYEPETQGAMKQLLDRSNECYSGDWVGVNIPRAADIIERAVLESKKVTEEKVRAACAAVAEVHLTNPKPESE